MRVTAIEYKIAKWYIYLLTIRMLAPLSALSDALHGAGLYFDVILHVIGGALIILKSRSLPSTAALSMRLFLYFVRVVIFCNLTTVIMAVYTQITLGSYANETAFEGILGMQIYYFQYVFMLLYNMFVFDILGKEQILKTLHRLCMFLLVLGYFQIACRLIGSFKSVLDAIDVFKVLQPGHGSLEKLTLTGSEGASGGSLLACLVFPILFSRYIVCKSRIEIVKIILFLPILFFTLSTTAFILSFSCFASFSFFAGKKSKIMILSFISVLTLFVSVAFTMLNSDDRELISYILLEKATDQENGSTVSRSVPYYINLGAFTESPIIGVGNGLQGYYHNKYFPKWALDVKGSDVGDYYDTAQSRIANGSLFFPSILSGYGLVGFLLFSIFFVRSFNLVRKYKKYLGQFSYIYMIAIIPIILCGFQTEFAGVYYIWFLLSIPLFIRKENPCNSLK